MRRPPWPDEIMEYHRELYAERLSHSSIADAVNSRFGHMGRIMTRNASIGIAHRHGYGVRPPSIPRKRKAPVKRNRPVKPRKVKEPEPMPMNISLLELRDHRTCKWPVSGEGAETRFCGARPLWGSSYCPHHKARSVQSTTPAKKKQMTAYGAWLSQRIIMAGG